MSLRATEKHQPCKKFNYKNLVKCTSTKYPFLQNLLLYCWVGALHFFDRGPVFGFFRKFCYIFCTYLGQ